MKKALKSKPIGVFDSGVGGLTVLQALQAQCPGEDFVYLGDTARLPYGTKSPETIIRYALQVASILVANDVKLIVVACNTATTIAMAAIQRALPFLPIIGVVEPTARMAVTASKAKRIAVIATEATVNSQGYQQAIQKIDSQIRVSARSTGLLVALAEEGWCTGPIAEAILRRYLAPLLQASQADCLLLACTHFPILQDSIQHVIGPEVMIVNSAVATAIAVADVLQREGLSNPQAQGATQYKVTDCPERFARVAQFFLQQPFQTENIQLLDINSSGSVLDVHDKDRDQQEYFN